MKLKSLTRRVPSHSGSEADGWSAEWCVGGRGQLSEQQHLEAKSWSLWTARRKTGGKREAEERKERHPRNCPKRCSAVKKIK